jgi:hypothetical protein
MDGVDSWYFAMCTARWLAVKRRQRMKVYGRRGQLGWFYATEPVIGTPALDRGK